MELQPLSVTQTALTHSCKFMGGKQNDRHDFAIKATFEDPPTHRCMLLLSLLQVCGRKPCGFCHFAMEVKSLSFS